MNETEQSDKVAQGDPSDADFIEHLVEAIGRLAALGRPSTEKDRSIIRAERDLPRTVFSYLAKKQFILPTGDQEKERKLAPEIAALASEPDRLLTYLWERVGMGRGGRRQPSVYVAAIHDVLRAWAAERHLDVETDGRGHILASSRDWKSILWGPLQSEADRWIKPSDRHRWLHHMRSSQSFALNLFGPLKLGMPWAAEIWASHFPGTTSVQFEYPTTGDPLLETKPPERLSRTRADVRLDAPSGDTWLVEVKLTEPEFGSCSAGHDPENELQSASCRAEFRSLQILQESCYLHRIGRAYFRMLERPDSLIDPAKLAPHGTQTCPLRQDLYQIVRNLLLVQSIRANEQRHARFAVVAPSRNLNPSLHEVGGREHDLTLFLRSILKATEQGAAKFVDFAGVVEEATKRSEPLAHDWGLFMNQRYLSPLAAGRRAVLDTEAQRSHEP
jgi:hypothetical protein